MLPTEEIFGENWEGKKKNGVQMYAGIGEKRKASSNQVRTGMLLRRQISDAKLLFKYSVYSNYQIQYKNRDIY